MRKEYGIGNYDKLIRDKVPDIIRDSGKTPETHIATGEEYVTRLGAKISEEVGELLAAKTPEQIDEEIGDVLEALRSYAQLNGRDMRVIEGKRQTKYTTRGGFSRGVVLEKVIEEGK